MTKQGIVLCRMTSSQNHFVPDGTFPKMVLCRMASSQNHFVPDGTFPKMVLCRMASSQNHFVPDGTFTKMVLCRMTLTFFTNQPFLWGGPKAQNPAPQVLGSLYLMTLSSSTNTCGSNDIQKMIKSNLPTSPVNSWWAIKHNQHPF